MYNIVRVGDSLLSSVLVAFVSRTTKSKTEIAAPSVPGRAQRLALFGPPPLIEGEDAAAYDQLLARIFAAVKPVDVIDEIFIADVAPSEWEVLRLRRLKWSLIRAPALEALENFLRENLDYDLYSEDFADDLAEILQDNAETQDLARQVAEAQIDLRRVRYARHKLLSDALADPHYDSWREKMAVLWKNAPDLPVENSVAFLNSTPQGSHKLATILSQEAKQLVAMDRYERRALSRRKSAIRSFDETRR
jgi:hypothetical protein